MPPTTQAVLDIRSSDPLKYFKSHITDNSGGITSIFMEKIFQHFEIDENGYIINEPEDCNFD